MAASRCASLSLHLDCGTASSIQARSDMAIRKGKRELIDTDKRYVKRNQDGTFKDSVDVGRSLAADRRSKSKTVAKAGYGDQGDQAKPSSKKKQAAKKSAKKR
jgi:hypothetical protein